MRVVQTDLLSCLTLMAEATGSGGPYWPASPHPERSPLVILTSREFLSGKEDWDDQNLALPSGALRMKTSTLSILSIGASKVSLS